MPLRQELAAIVAVGLVLLGTGIVSAQEKAPDVQVGLLADRTAWVPGEKAEVAIGFQVPDGWHVYWRNPGEGGLEPTFKWKLPEGWSVGELVYPFPARHLDAGGEHTFILEGEPTILTAISVPREAIAGTTVTVSLDVRWMACRKACFLGNKTLTLTLPVAGGNTRSEPANEDVFQLARSYLPVPAAEAKHLKRLWAAASVNKAKPGDKFEVAVVFDVADGHHINSHKPLNEFLVQTDVFNDRVEGLYIGRARFPSGKLEAGLPGEQVSLYRGRAVVVLPVEAEPGLTGDRVRISGVAIYQACSDQTKVCYPPMAVDWEIVLPVAKPDEAVTPANADLFAAARREIPPEEQKAPASGPGTPSTKGADEGVGPAVADRNAASQGGIGPTGVAGSAAPAASPTTSDTWLGRFQAFLMGLGVVGYLVLALLGGFVLNLMPCVLPVISIKVLSFVQQAKESRLRVLTLGLAFAAGIELSFVVLGLLIVLLGRTWGGLFQYPQMIIGLSAVVTAFALSLFGVFAIFPPRVVGDLAVRVEGEGHLSAFGMGLLATLLGTACTAPFLTGAVALATRQSPVVGMLIFITAGLGMSLPYVILAAKPVWVVFLPKAGPWMVTFERVVGFCLLATVVWLLNPLSVQIGGEGLLLTLLFLLLVSLGAWLYGKVEYGAAAGRKATYYGLTIAVIGGGWWLCFGYMATIPDLIERQRSLLLGERGAVTSQVEWKGDQIPWIPYTRERARKAVEAGNTIFIDYTAEWCLNCKTNEKAVINTEAVREAMKRLRVLPFKADYTLPNPEIAEDLKKYGSGGVPMYLIIPAGQPNNVIRLDEILTPGALIAGLDKAAGNRK